MTTFLPAALAQSIRARKRIESELKALQAELAEQEKQEEALRRNMLVAGKEAGVDFTLFYDQTFILNKLFTEGKSRGLVLIDLRATREVYDAKVGELNRMLDALTKAWAGVVSIDLEPTGGFAVNLNAVM